MTSGRFLNEKWGVNAKHALYHKEGTWYHILDQFPGALFDRNGYILFKTQKEFLKCNNLKIGEHVNVLRGISKIPGYVRID